MTSSDKKASSDDSGVQRHQDLEIKDAHLIFNSVFQNLEQEYGRDKLRFPSELILLGGAPGAGKGTNTDFILKLRGITTPPIVVSSLLNTPEARKIKDAGGMVGDKEVVGILLRTLLDPVYQNGALLDGFPRTNIQVECLKLLHEKMIQLQRDFDRTPNAIHFRRPVFHIVMLFVEEKESIERQLKRGREIKAHNDEVRLTGIGELQEERSTDTSIETARKRYAVFKEKTFDALQSLKALYHYHFINAHGSIAEVQERIIEEFRYQSALELDPRTFEVIRGLPLADEITTHARQELVRRIEGYELTTPDAFHRMIDFVGTKLMPIIVRHAISGQANINTEDPILNDEHALTMLIDILSERGYHAVVDVHNIEIPSSFDLKTGEIHCRQKRVYRIIVRFKGSEIRRG